MGLGTEHSHHAALIALLGAVALCFTGAAQAADPAPGAQAPAVAAPLTNVKVVQCRRGPTAADRVVVFRAEMRRIPRSVRLSVRLRLQESVRGARYRFVKAPGLGVWRSSHAGVGAFAYRQKVKALADGSAYRVVVGYRWQNARGEVLKRARRQSGACHQTEPLPNLRVQRIGGKPVAGFPGRTQYAVSVFNAGTAASPATELELTVDGTAAGRSAVPALAVGQIARVLIEGPKCSGNLGAEVDPDALVHEASEIDNGRSAPCPMS